MADINKEFEEFIAKIKDDVIRCLNDRHFFEKLDDILCPADSATSSASCAHSYEISKRLLSQLGFSEDDLADIFNIFQLEGGFCDCEILYNAVETSRLKEKYWSNRVRGSE